MILPTHLSHGVYPIEGNNLNVDLLRPNNVTGDFLNLMEQLSPVDLTVPEAKAVCTAMLNRQPYSLTFTGTPTGRPVCASVTLVVEQKFLHGGGRAGRIEDMIVHKDARRSGIGRNLIDHVVQVAKFAGCYKIVLESRPVAKKFWASVGFEKAQQGFRMNLYNPEGLDDDLAGG